MRLMIFLQKSNITHYIIYYKKNNYYYLTARHYYLIPTTCCRGTQDQDTPAVLDSNQVSPTLSLKDFRWTVIDEKYFGQQPQQKIKKKIK